MEETRYFRQVLVNMAGIWHKWWITLSRPSHHSIILLSNLEEDMILPAGIFGCFLISLLLFDINFKKGGHSVICVTIV